MKRVITIILTLAICIFLRPLLLSAASPVAGVECKDKLPGLTVFLASNQQWSITWAADGIHKSDADYYGNIKNRTNKQDSRGDKRAEKLPHQLLRDDEQFRVPFDNSVEGKLLAALYGK